MERDKFSELYKIPIENEIEKKKVKEGVYLDYLSWAKAWRILKEHAPDATFSILSNPNTGEQFWESSHGVAVRTTVTVSGETLEMRLHCMTGACTAIPPDRVTESDINKAIMRCLTKNIALFGLGLKLYEGEDLKDDEQKPAPARQQEKVLQFSEELLQKMVDHCVEKGIYVDDLVEMYKKKNTTISKELEGALRKALVG